LIECMIKPCRQRQRVGVNATVTDRWAHSTTTVPPSTTTTTNDVTSNTTDFTVTPPTVNHTYSYAGRCPDMPTGVDVNILYTEAGLTNSRPIYMIVGAHIT